MGMYDTINGEQVKCFPWVSLYNDTITYHGGDLKYYGIGDEVPWRKPHYNYTKNFIILDLNRYPESEYCPYDYILHVIVDGKVKETFENEIGEIDWSINNCVVSYTGELLNIKSSEDLEKYMIEQKKFWVDYEDIRSKWNDLFKESMDYFHGIALLDKDSEERKYRNKKIEEIHKLMQEEEDRTKEVRDKLCTAHSDKWFLDKDIYDLVALGDCIAAYQTSVKSEREEVEECKSRINNILTEYPEIYDKYVEWQGVDEYIKEFI